MAYSPVTLAGLALLVLYGIHLLHNRLTIYRSRRAIIAAHGCKPIQGRYPHRDPILGIDFIRSALAAKAKGEFLARESGLYAQLGNTYVFHVFGVGMISTAEPENMKAIFATKFDDWSTGERNRVLEPLLGKGIFTTEGESWAHSRVMIRPNFSRAQISDLERLEGHVGDLLALLPPEGDTVDLQPLFFRLMMDSATDLLFGRSVHSLKEADALQPDKKAVSEEAEQRPAGQAFAHAFDLAQEYCNVRFLYGPLGKIMPQAREDREAVALCRRFIQPYVDQAVAYRDALDTKSSSAADPEAGYTTFLQEIASQTTDRIRLRDELMNLLVAGRDTTASMLSNLFHTLAKKPDVWGKLRAETEDTLQGALPTFEQLKNMKYLQWTIKESLRLHPPVPGLAREANKDTVLPVGGGHDGKSPLFIKKGQVVMPVFFGMHRRKDLFGADANDFRPERWEKLRTGWEYIPFSGGPRICLGQQYALTEAAYVIVRFLQQFKTLESRDPESLKEAITLTMASLNGVKVALTPA